MFFSKKAQYFTSIRFKIIKKLEKAVKYGKIKKKGGSIMTREELIEYVENVYSSFSEYPWKTAPSFAVFRHSNNKKWFAVIMNIQKSKLGIHSQEFFDIVNLKIDPNLLGSLLIDDGIYPAYHMNKNHWISVALDELPREKLEFLLDMSWELTK